MVIASRPERSRGSLAAQSKEGEAISCLMQVPDCEEIASGYTCTPTPLRSPALRAGACVGDASRWRVVAVTA